MYQGLSLLVKNLRERIYSQGMRWLFVFFLFSLNGNAVTYNFSGGRFGDNLVAYLHAKWISHKYNFPLYYKPFPLSNALKLEEGEPLHFDESTPSLYEKRIWMSNQVQIEENPKCSTLYVIPFFPDFPYEYECAPQLKNHPFFTIDWDDQEFKKEVRQLIQPKEKLKTRRPKKGTVGIAIHVRRHTNERGLENILPQKSPPDEYYIEQLKYLCSIYRGYNIHAHIFTDYPYPQKLVELYQKSISKENLTITCDPNATPLEDFFSFQNFRCLIRPDSNFSYVAGRLHDFAFEISPAHYRREEGKLVIDKVKIKRKKR